MAQNTATTPGLALETRDLGLTYGKFVALAEVDLHMHENSVHMIIGPNAAGKTALFHALTGKVSPSSVQVILNGHDITHALDTERVQRGLARSFQVTSLFPDLDVRENLRRAAFGRRAADAGHRAGVALRPQTVDAGGAGRRAGTGDRGRDRRAG